MSKKNKGPDLDMYLEGKRDRYVSYYDGAKRFGLPYTMFMKLCKECGANIAKVNIKM